MSAASGPTDMAGPNPPVAQAHRLHEDILAILLATMVVALGVCRTGEVRNIGEVDPSN